MTPEDRAARARLTRSAALASITMALFLGALKGWAAWQTGSTAMLGSLADTALDLVASLATLSGVWFAAQPADERAPLRPRQGRGAGGDVPGHADRDLGRRDRFSRDDAASSTAVRKPPPRAKGSPSR